MTDAKPVEPMDSTKSNSPVVADSGDESTVVMNRAANTCTWNGETFDDGDTVIAEGVVYECSFGSWVQQD